MRIVAKKFLASDGKHFESVARDPLLRRIITAYLASHPNAHLQTTVPASRATLEPWHEPGSTHLPNGRTMYIVHFNDSLGAIAARFGVSEQRLMQENTLTDKQQIHPGQRLLIPSADPVAEAIPTAVVTDALEDEPTFNAAARWLEVLASHGVDDLVEADLLAWTAYQA
ncbi:MAG: LysM peptidoglycan-binding domain-containing protein, partial [Burkholderiales bacterium]|nr:LysM peptidoglycan-binding domain-containing protein [Burkholderiales bacterium]